MAYTVAESTELALLIEEVNRLESEGWVVQGGVASLVIGPNQHFAQAMVRADGEEEEEAEAVEVATVSGLLFYKGQATEAGRNDGQV
jgi:hypothetical protein